MKLRKTAAITLVALTTLGMAACNRGTAGPGGDAPGGKPVVLGLAVANLQADFFNQIKQSVTAEAEKQGW